MVEAGALLGCEIESNDMRSKLLLITYFRCICSKDSLYNRQLRGTNFAKGRPWSAWKVDTKGTKLHVTPSYRYEIFPAFADMRERIEWRRNSHAYSFLVFLFFCFQPDGV